MAGEAGLLDAAGAALDLPIAVTLEGEDVLSSCFAVTALAAASVGAVGAAIARLIATLGLAAHPPAVHVDRTLASLWFARSIHPVGWTLPPAWDAIAGDYATRDGFIKLHTNLPHHRAAALAVLNAGAERGAVAAAVAGWEGDALEAAIVAHGGVAAAMRSEAEWARHPQGRAVSAEPLIAWEERHPGQVQAWAATRARPLAGLRVLDLTRVLAGPVATRTLAGFGADVLRIDPPGWEEPNVVPDVTLGKACARLRLDTAADRATFERLLGEADVLVHGYRPGALAGLGYGGDVRRRIAPALIEVTLDAYGWSGPWAARRGFDSLVQMSCGIADTGMRWAGRAVPTPLPVQALDHATGYLMAAAVVRALDAAVRGEGIGGARLSLARTAALLVRHRQEEAGALTLAPGPDDLAPAVEATPWGAARRLHAPVLVAGAPLAWERPAGDLGSSPARFATAS